MIGRINTNNQKFNAAVENTANQHSDNFMNAITALSTSVTRNFPSRPKGTKRSVSSVESGNDGPNNNADGRFYCNGVHVDADNWKNCITSENKDNIPFIFRKMIGFCREHNDFNPHKRNDQNDARRRRRGKSGDRDVSETNTNNDDSPPTNGDNNNNDDVDMSKDNTANQLGTKFGNRGKKKDK